MVFLSASISDGVPRFFVALGLGLLIMSLSVILVVIWIAIAAFNYGVYVKRANAYAFTDKRVLVHRGWFSTETLSVDYDKITGVTVVEPFFDKLITHSGHIAINTAGAGPVGKEIVLMHVAHPYEIKKKLDQMR